MLDGAFMKSMYVILALMPLLLSACSGEEPIPTGNAAGEVMQKRFGDNAHDGAVLTADRKFLWRQAVLTGYVEPSFKRPPARIEFMKQAIGCGLPHDAVQDKITLVHVDGNRIETPLYRIRKDQIDERVRRQIETWKSNGQIDQADAYYSDDQLHYATVVVTETAKPVHLVLASHAQMLWTLQVAEGVRISRVSVVSPTYGAVVNVPANVEVTGLFGPAAASCKASPFRAPAPHWGIMSEPRSKLNDDIIASRRQVYNSFANWYRNALGAESEAGAVGAEVGAFFLVGPPPATKQARVAFKDMPGAVLFVGAGEQAIFGERATYAAKHDEVIAAAARRRVGNDLTALVKK